MPEQAKHTPGKWRIRTPCGEGECEVFSVVDIHAHIVARVSGISLSAIPPKERKANARLIAAAPDLLAACKQVVAYWEEDTIQSPQADGYGQCAVAIAAATGEST